MIKIIKKATITLLAFLMCFTSGHWMVFADDDHITITIMDGDQEYESSYIWTEDVYGFNLYYKGDNLYSEGFAESLEDAENGVINYRPTDGYEFDEDKTFYIVWKEGYTVNYSIDGEIDQSLTRKNANRFDFLPNADLSREGYRLSGWFADPEYTEEFNQDMLNGDVTLYSYFKKLYKVTYYDDTTELGSRYFCNGDNIQIDPSEFEGFIYPGATLCFDYWWHGNSEEPYTGELTEDIQVFLKLCEAVYVNYYDQYGNLLETKLINPRLWNCSPEEISGLYLDANDIFRGWGTYSGSNDVFSGNAYDGLELFAIIDHQYRVYFYNYDESYIGEQWITCDISEYHISNLLTDWEREGYRFIGWNSMPGSEYAESGYLMDGSSVYAVYRREYTVNYWLDENTPLESQKYIEGDYYLKEITELNSYTPREDGLVFYYWSETPGGEKCEVSLGRDMDLYAVFGEPVTVNYHFEDGSNMGSLITTPEKALTISTSEFGVDDVGGEFGGWSSAPYGKTVYDGEITDNIDLYRIVYRYYNVTYYIDGVLQDTRYVREDQYNQSINSFMGYENETRILLYWSLAPDGEEFSGCLTEDCTLYAVLLNGVRVNYWDFYGGELLETKIIENNNWNIDPSEVEGFSLNENEVFLGWTVWGGGYDYEGAVYTGDAYEGLNLFPVITELSSVKFYDENGTLLITKNMYGNIEDIDLSEIGIPYEKGEYVFCGWTTEPGKTDFISGSVYDGLELYAYYEIGYTIKYCLEDGTELLTKKKTIYNWYIDINSVYAVPAGKFFMHWSTEPNGEEFTGSLNADCTLYAVITDGFSVYYYGEKGEYLGTRKTGKYDWYIYPDSYTFDGYVEPTNSSFAGWTLTMGSKDIYGSNAYEGMSLYAVYTHYCDVTFHDGDTIITALSLGDKDYLYYSIRSFAGYEDDERNFLWWSTDKNSTVMYDESLTEDVDLYAVFGTGGKVYYHRMDGTELGIKGILGDGREWDISPSVFKNYVLDDNRVFIGWSEYPWSLTLYEGSVYDGLQLYAAESVIYDVSYYDGETLLGTETVMEGRNVSHKAITDFANYEANGRFFKYWTRYPETEEQYADDGVYSDLVLYAVYGNAYDVTYYDGNIVLGTEKVGEGDYIGYKPITDFADYNADGRIFKFWSNNPESEEQYTGYVYSNMSLYAVFEKQYNVSYYDGDTLLGTRLVTSYDWDRNIEEIVPTYEKPGYKFTGWTATKGGREPGYYDDLYEGLILYAVYKKTYTVEYNYNGEVIYTNNRATEFEYSYYPDIQLPQGYSFAYWTLDLNTKKEFYGPITGDTVLYAVIGKTNPVISLNSNGGNLYNRPVILTLHGIYGLSEYDVNSNYVPVKEGYKFIGWSRSKDDYDPDLNSFLDDTTLYAYYTREGYGTFKLYFGNVNGSDTEGLVYEVERLDEEIRAGETITATIRITDDDYYFYQVYWGSGVFVPANNAEYLERTFTIEVQEGINALEITLGKGNLNVKFVTGDDPDDYVLTTTDRFGNIVNIPEIEKSGYFLAGWSSDNGDYYNGIGKFDVKEGSVFYPIWQEAGNTCNVEFRLSHDTDNGLMEFDPDYLTVTGDRSGLSGDWYAFDVTVADTACGLGLVMLDENGNEITSAL